MAPRKAAEKKPADKEILIPPIRLETIPVRIAGITGLITNKFSERAIRDIESVQQHEAKSAKPPRDPDAEFRDAAHILSPGVYGFPSTGIKKALVAAGFRFADEKGTHLRGIINIPQAHVVIEAPKPKMRTDPVRLRGAGFTVAYRPEFFPWAMTVPIVFNAAIISPAQILNLFQIAGFSVGLGSWRPESNGTFGQFVLDESGAAMAA